MNKLGYRDILPVVQFVVYVFLIWNGGTYFPLARYWAQNWIKSGSGDVKSLNWGYYLNFRPSPSEQLAFGINAPATIAVMLATAPFDSAEKFLEEILANFTITGFCVPILWYFIGKRLDRPVIIANRPSTWAKARVALVLLIALLAASIAAMGAITQPQGVLLFWLLGITWAVAAILVSLRTIRAWRRNAPAV